MQPPLSEEQKQEVMRRIERSVAFQRTFRGKDGELVLNELKNMRRGFDPDPYIHAYNAGIRSLVDFIDTAMNQDIENARKILEEQKKNAEASKK